MPDNNSPASGSSLSGGSIDSDFPSLDEPGRVAPPLRQSVPNFVDTDFNKVVGDGERPASASQGPKSRILWRALFAIIVLCTIAYGVFLHAKRPNEQPAFPAGWIDLAACSDAISLDGTRQLALSEDQTAEMTETTSQTEGKNERKTRGKWSYDETAKKYGITFNDETTSYSLLSKDHIATCILVKGDFGSGNLLESWFATFDNGSDDGPEYDPH
jgi:hypothetical protein